MAYLAKRGKIWYVRYRNNQGKMAWKSTGLTSKKRAEAEYLTPVKERERTDGFGIDTCNDFSLKDLFNEFMKRKGIHYSEKWRFDLNHHFKKLFSFFGENIPIKSITGGLIEDYRAMRLRTVSRRTVNIEVHHCLLLVLRYGYKQGYLKKVPEVKRLSIPEKKPRFLTKQEIKALGDAAENHSSQMLAYCFLMLWAGLRQGEALSLRWADVDFERNLIHVQNREDWQTKTGKVRHVPIPSELLRFLKSRKHENPESELVCEGEHTPYAIMRAFKKVVKKAELPISGENKVTQHTLRHTYASHLVMNGVPLYTVGELLGHSDPKTTKIYSHLAPDHLHSAVQSLDFS